MEPHVERFVSAVRDRGVIVHAPETVEVSSEVQPERFAEGAVLHAGTRIHGGLTYVGPGAEIGREAPVTLVDAHVGPGVRVAGGFVEGAVLLEGAQVGSGAQIRPATLLEERARVAHTVGLKQTILMPYATLGSLANFCDCLLAGGTGPRDHSEVGSGFIHFNFTPRGPKGDKATPSLFGDVPHGVMLDQPRIFLGGDGGAVGPLTVGYGAVLAAGHTYRRDCPAGLLRSGETWPVSEQPFDSLTYGDVTRKWRLNLAYLGNLVALWHWYREVRLPSATPGSPAEVGYAAALEVVAAAIEERSTRLADLVEALELSSERLAAAGVSNDAHKSQLRAVKAWPDVIAWLDDARASRGDSSDRERFLAAWEATRGAYLERVHGLPDEARRVGARWLHGYVDGAIRAGDAA